ncbi:WH2 motif domain contaning protein [Entamoeba histolytica HM-1:IMSS]|uniref:WH2 motif domain contaning protein n=1 Tax=Entamoeba histolytica (strain ATCC 30459 / HM-1:IMSS / ABRM) TaxID=294381 RepID=C4MBT4_ENTH1|nr:WH2 motif domain contaning protein [Entamoeba histolytica HM-1:IMSS]EAL42522.1 WH2 motif domain contaning protein [Entamoeba histolytica HM-1:IMSS]|eukprot:XP_647908.1 WH2 motif domain contaning protein [Entamoeba histolytica HM-1:IMSS]
MPELTLPNTLPNLSNVAELSFRGTSPLFSIAPSVELPDINLDEEDDEASFETTTTAIPPPPPSVTSTVVAPPPPPPPSTASVVAPPPPPPTAIPKDVPPAAAEKLSSGGMGGLLEQIRGGKKLKKVQLEEGTSGNVSQPEPKKPTTGGNDLMEALMLKLKTMRAASNYDANEDDDDSAEWN